MAEWAHKEDAKVALNHFLEPAILFPENDHTL
jgi:hypothetical protein